MHRLTRGYGRRAGTEEDLAAAREAFVIGCAEFAQGMEIFTGFRLYLPNRSHLETALEQAAGVLGEEDQRLSQFQTLIGFALQSAGDLAGAQRQVRHDAVRRCIHGRFLQVPLGLVELRIQAADRSGQRFVPRLRGVDVTLGDCTGPSCLLISLVLRLGKLAVRPRLDQVGPESPLTLTSSPATRWPEGPRVAARGCQYPIGGSVAV